MALSRRRFLRASPLALTALAGCGLFGGASSERTPTATRTPESAAQTTTVEPPATPESTDTPEPTASMRCGTGPVPDSGWPTVHGSVGRTNYAPAAAGPTETPTATWTQTASEPAHGRVRFTRPVVADDRVYVGRQVLVGPEVQKPDRQYVHAYDTVTGDRQWRAPVSGTPTVWAVADGAVYVSDRTVVYALDAATGEEWWRYDADGTIQSVLPTPAGILVGFTRADADDVVVALAGDGTVDWRLAVPEWIDSDLAWVDGRAYYVTTHVELVAIDTEAVEIAWTNALHDSDNASSATLAVTPCAAFVAVDSALYAVRRSGEVAWDTEPGGRDLATDGEHIYAVTADGFVRSLAAADGTPEWERRHGATVDGHTDGFTSGLAMDGATIYAGTGDEHLVAVSSADGQQRWQLARDWDGASTSVAGESVYVAWGTRLAAFRRG